MAGALCGAALALPAWRPAWAEAACVGTLWPLWQRFVARYVLPGGRVADFSVPQVHSTSEGQSYAMFFALVANDPALFDTLWRWTVDNLASGDIKAHLPAWQWGRREDGTWGVMDPNAASDADLWLAYDLLEAARLWNKPEYRRDALALLARVVHEEVVDLPGFGSMLLPGPMGFALPGRLWRLNASYLPLPLLRRFAAEDPKGPWAAIATNFLRMLQASAVNGFVADWVGYQSALIGPGSFIADPVKADVGSYDAIRCYLWAGVTAPQDPLRQANLRALWGMRSAVAQSGGLPPEKVGVLTGQLSGTGPVGFSAALLPYLQAWKDEAGLQAQLRRLEGLSGSGGTELPVYYDIMLSLFGLGWIQGRYRFSPDGRLATAWAGAC